MNFYIKKIRLWFNNHPEPQDYEFHPNKVNVVTGDSSTGKSSILRIIDYCLMAQESTIVDDVINNNVSWYGLSFHLNGRDYVVARKSPFNGRINQDIYWAKDTDEFPQGSHPRPTPEVKRQDVLDYLNKEFAIPQILMGDNKKKLALTFRHTLLLNFLTEEIIATANRYLDTLFFDDDDMIGFDSRILKISLGADEKKEAELTEKVKTLDESIKKEDRNKTNDEKNRQAYEKKYNAVLATAKAIGLIDESEAFDTEVVLARIKEAVDHFNRIKRSHAKLKELAELSDRQQKLKVEIYSYKKLKYEIVHKEPKYIEKISDEARNLLSGLLNKNPLKRLTCDQILNHPWFSDINNNKNHLFSKSERALLSKTYIDYRKNKLEDLIENFTISNLFNDKKNTDIEYNNCETKSSLLAPFNSLNYNYFINDIDIEMRKNIKLDDNFDDFNNKNILVEKDLIQYSIKAKEFNFQYELNNNKEVDNGVLINSKSFACSSNSSFSNANTNRNEIENGYKGLEFISKDKIEEILNQIESMGYDRDYVIKSVKKNLLNHASTIFFLLIQYENI